MKILVIGGTGHVGSFLVPKLLSRGAEVYIGTRGRTPSKDENGARGAKFITVNAADDESLRSLKAEGFDVIIDFPGTAKRVWDILSEDVGHIIACGSLWMFGRPAVLPTPEVKYERCFDDYYEKRFCDILQMQKQSGQGRAVFTAIMPTNICGPGKIPLDQYGGRDIELHKKMARGDKVYLPDGASNLVSPCDAEDIAELFALAAYNRERAAGEIFNAGSEYGFIMDEFIRVYSEIYGVEIPVQKVTWEKYTTEINPSKSAWWHFYSPMLPDISKAKRLLGYAPQHTPEGAMRRAVEWMRKENLL